VPRTHARSVDGLQPFQPLRDALLDRFLSGCRAVLQLALESDALVLVDAEAGRSLGIVDHDFFRDVRQQFFGCRIAVAGCARRQVGQGDRDTGAYNEVAAIRGHPSSLLKIPGCKARKHNIWDSGFC